MGEFIYTRVKEIKPSFKAIGFTRLDVILSTDYAIIRLKRNKTDKLHQSINILIVSIGDSNCLIQALKDLI